VEIRAAFPQECLKVVESLAEIYRIDAQAKLQCLDPQQRLELHQTYSQPVMEALKAWLDDQIQSRKAEPNSTLGQAIGYMSERWEPLTQFLRLAGAPLDNNITYAARGISDVMPPAGLCRVADSNSAFPA
jgi:hypothetical protein